MRASKSGRRFEFHAVVDADALVRLRERAVVAGHLPGAVAVAVHEERGDHALDVVVRVVVACAETDHRFGASRPKFRTLELRG